jgi:hypothetical protein
MNSTENPASGSSHTLSPPKQDDPTPTPEQRMRAAVARIEASRYALIMCLAPDPPRRRASTTGVDDSSDSSSEKRSFVDTLKARIERNGLLQGGWQTVRTLARRWWTRQSWHRSVDLVVETLVHEARPLMRRHPLATLATGAALGVGLVVVVSTVRPWVWHRIRGNGSSLGGRVGSLLWSQFSSAPVQMALAGALAAWVADQGIRRNTNSGAPSGGAAPRGDPADAAPHSVETPGTGSAGGTG